MGRDKSSNGGGISRPPRRAARETWASRLNKRNAFRKKLFQSVRKFTVNSCERRTLEFCILRKRGTQHEAEDLLRRSRTAISDPLSSRTRMVVEPPFVARENWGAGGLMNILWMHISRHHGITWCRRVPDKAPPLKNGPSYLSHEPLMGPIPASSRSNVFTFSRVTAGVRGLICI